MSLQRQIMLDSPVAYWPLDETSGTTVNDRSGNGRHGSISNPGVTLNQPMGPMRGYEFAGGAGSGTGYIGGIGNSSAFTPAGSTGVMTIEAFAVADTTSNSAMMLITKHLEWNLRAANGDMICFTVGGGGGSIYETTTAPFTAGVMYHWAVVYDRANTFIKLYKNGVLVATDTSVGGADSPYEVSNTSSNVYIGARHDSGGQLWDGKLAHIAYFNSALSADRVKAHYEAGIRGSVVY